MTKGGPVCEPFAWLDLCSLAAWRDRPEAGLERGELWASVRGLADRWRWNKNKVPRFLSELESEGMVQVLEADRSRGTRIRIANYDEYQGGGEDENPQLSLKLEADEIGGTRNGTRKPAENNGHENMTGHETGHDANGKGHENPRNQTGSKSGGDTRKKYKKYLCSIFGFHPQILARAPERQAIARAFMALVDAGLEEQDRIANESVAGDLFEEGRRDPVRVPLGQIRLKGNDLVRAWAASGQATGVSARDRTKQGAAARDLATDYGFNEIALMLCGLCYTFPYARGDAWDLFDLRRMAVKLMRNGRSSKEAEEDRAASRAMLEAGDSSDGLVPDFLK